VKIKKTETHLLTSTHIDKQNQAMSLEALESMVEQNSQKIIPLIIEHDPFCPPIGKVANARIEKLTDGHYGLYGDWIVYDFDSYKIVNLSGEKYSEFSSDDFTDSDESHFNIVYNPFVLQENEVENLRNSFDGSMIIKHKVEKSQSVIVIGILFVLTYILTKFSEGFIEGFTGISFEDYGKRTGIFFKEKLKTLIYEAAKILKNKQKEISDSKTVIELSFKYRGVQAEALVEITALNEDTIENYLDNALESIHLLFSNVAILHKSFPKMQNCKFIYDSRINDWSVIYVLEQNGEVSLGINGKKYLENVNV
jgi:hypothetical protein